MVAIAWVPTGADEQAETVHRLACHLLEGGGGRVAVARELRGLDGAGLSPVLATLPRDGDTYLLNFPR